MGRAKIELEPHIRDWCRTKGLSDTFALLLMSTVEGLVFGSGGQFRKTAEDNVATMEKQWEEKKNNGKWKIRT